MLKKNLINQHSPFFNADFKDDKSYPFIALTKGDVFPAIKYTREKHRSDTRYFGPYTDSRAARDMVDIARRVVPLCACSCAAGLASDEASARQGPACVAQRGSPSVLRRTCRSRAGCMLRTRDAESYADNVERITRFLSGHHREFIEELTSEMQQAAADLDFERAGRVKARIDTINSLTDKQHAVSSRNLDADVIGIYHEETRSGRPCFHGARGTHYQLERVCLNRGSDVPDQDLLHNFLLRYYDTTTSIPHEVIVHENPDDVEVMQEWLTGKLNSPHGAKVRFVEPRKGEKAELVDMAETNAKHTLMRYKVRTNYDDKRINDALMQLESALALDGPPMRIECFDISTIHGSYTVASMVVFTGGNPTRTNIVGSRSRRRSTRRTTFFSMQEVMSRRYAPRAHGG